MKNLTDRNAVLQNEIHKYVRMGYLVQSSSQTQVILTKKKKIRVLTHVVFALLTAGIWLIIPLIQIINRKQATVIVSVDEFGNIIVG